MAIPKPEVSAAELETLVLDVMTAEGRPVTVTDIHRAMPKALRPAAKALAGVVSALADAKRIFRSGRRYSAQPDRTLHERILRITGDEARTTAELAKQLRTSATRVREAIRELVESGELHAYPKQQRVIRYGVQPPTPAALLRPELARLLASAKKLGIGEDAARQALRELLGGGTAQAADPVVAAIRELAPEGALVYLPHLRTALAASYRDKPSFDRALLGLLARGTIQMQSHPTPSLLGAAERDAMIEDGRGGYYSAVGLR
ncbi:MAG TPA: winged helix-turn-helix domain-containing protein [Thermoanaerobaculia bacterium]|jgi:DNA-binding transcriptional regulator YhcF (GntR family)